MDVLLLTLLVALCVWSARKVVAAVKTRRSRARRAAAAGASADNPIVLRSATQLNEALAAVRCPCGGTVRALGETSRLGLRVARGRCVECEEDVDVYFVLPNFVN